MVAEEMSAALLEEVSVRVIEQELGLLIHSVTASDYF